MIQQHPPFPCWRQRYTSQTHDATQQPKIVEFLPCIELHKWTSQARDVSADAFILMSSRRPDHIMHVSEKGIDRGSDEESIHMPVGPRNSVLVTCPPCLCLRPDCREIFTLCDDSSVCDSVCGSWRLRKCRCLAHDFLESCQLGQQRCPK